MSAAAIRFSYLEVGHREEHCTLLELVEAIGEVTDNDRDVVATVSYMLRSGRIKLRGTFRNEPVHVFSD